MCFCFIIIIIIILGAAAESSEAAIHAIESTADFNEIAGHAAAGNSPAKRAKQSHLAVVQYWAPWCRNCLKLTPELNKIAREFASASFYKVVLSSVK